MDKYNPEDEARLLAYLRLMGREEPVFVEWIPRINGMTKTYIPFTQLDLPRKRFNWRLFKQAVGVE